MKLKLGPLPENDQFNPEKPWRPLDEPGPKTFIWVALPFGIFAAVSFAILWLSFTPVSWAYFKFWVLYANFPLYNTLVLAAVIVIHELLHAVVQPGYGLHSTIGLWLRKGAFYAYYDDEWSRNRALLCFLFPFFMLTIMPLIVCSFPVSITSWIGFDTTYLLCFISVMNALCACGDLMCARLIFWQVPANGTIRNKSFYTYWRVRNQK